MRALTNTTLILTALLLAACTSQPTQTFQVMVEAYASPTCPVETDPPDPRCAPRPLVGATVEVIGPSGRVVEVVTTDGSGKAVLSLPAGRYRFRPGPIDRFATPKPRSLEVADDLPGLGVVFHYDTGIRTPTESP